MAKVMVSLPDDLLRDLDAEAQARGMTRSGLLRDYVQEGMQRRTQERIRRMKEILAEPVEPTGPDGFRGDVVALLKEEREKRLAKLDALARPRDV